LATASHDRTILVSDTNVGDGIQTFVAELKGHERPVRI